MTMTTELDDIISQGSVGDLDIPPHPPVEPVDVGYPGGWAWLTQPNRPPMPRTRHGVLWDGIFIARCPCGRTDVEWNAYRFEPRCDCP